MPKTDDVASIFLKMPGSELPTPNPVREVLGCLRMFGVGLNKMFWWVFLAYMLTNISKR